MSKSDFTLKFIKDANQLRQLSDTLTTLPAFALDIETSNWWNRRRERIALIQIAFRLAGQIKVVIIDALPPFDPAPLRLPLEQSSILKIIHNAAFDAVRLNDHYDFNVAPVFDTMAAARRGKERKYSLSAQAEIHLALRLDKSAQRDDWSRRPLAARQLHYAALDPFATLLLYENQKERNLNGSITGSKHLNNPAQNLLPLDKLPAVEPSDAGAPLSAEGFSSEIKLPAETAALLGIITELPGRYSPDALAASVGAERVGLAGWIIDRRLGTDAEPDEETVKLAIGDLCEKNLIRITPTRRLEATVSGSQLWETLK